MKTDMKTLGADMINELRTAGESFKNKESDYQTTQEVYMRNREICRVLALQTKIAEISKKSPSKGLQQFAGVSEE